MTLPAEQPRLSVSLREVSARLEELQLPNSELYALSPRNYGWLGDHQDEAAELAALLHEAAPKLVLANLRGAAGHPRPSTPLLPKARSYELSDLTKDRLRAAVPIPTGPGQVDWSKLTAVISSELLSFHDAADATADALQRRRQAQAQPAEAAEGAAAAAQGVTSPRSPGGGDMLEINSGGRVVFCLFAPDSRAPTPPSSLRNSPEKEPSSLRNSPQKEARFMRHAACVGPPAAAAARVSGLAAEDSSSAAPSIAGSWRAPAGANGAGDGSPGRCSRSSSGSLDASLLPSASDPDLTALCAGGRGPGALAQRSSGSFSFPAPPPPLAGSAPHSPQRLRRLASGAGKPEGCLVLKFVSSRLICQSELFASELTRHVGLCAPESRILRQKGATEGEWREAYEAAAALRERAPDLYEEMTRNSCCLVMEYVPGQCLFKALPAIAAVGALERTAEDLGRLFTLDMLLGNADRLPCRELGWRGNPENVLFASAGSWAGRAVAIDAVVQRRPPGGLMSVEDRSCERLAELALNDAEVAGSLLRQALQPCADALAALEPAAVQAAAAAFQRGLKAALQAAASIKGLLEMMFEVITDWIDSFIEDIEVASSSAGGAPHATTPRAGGAPRRASSAGAAASPLLLAASSATTAQTMRIRQINHEAQRNDSVGERVAHWKAVFREKGEELRAAVEEWQLKRGPPAEGNQRLTTAFLDGTHPVVDVYELKVRLEHMLQRLRVLQQATLTGRPARLLPRLYLSGAVEASSLHLLRHLGITHVLNATEDLLLPEEGAGFVTHRVPLRDVEEEDITPHLPEASAFIDEGLASGGAVLVHCHAGKSRSCSLVLAWLMTRRRWPLKRALDFLQQSRPEAAPNAGYLAALLRLEEELFGRQTVKMKKTKPEPRACPECGEKVGLSAESVRVHLRLKHPASALARACGDAGSGSWQELPSPSASSVGQQSPRSRSGQPSPKTQLSEQPGQWWQQQPVPQQPGQQKQQQEQPVSPQQAAAGPWQGSEASPACCESASSAAAGGTPPPARLSHTRVSALAAEASEGIPDSPPSMAAVLRAESGGLSECDAEEFLSSAPSTATF